MTEQSMMRLAMVLQNQAPKTLDKYIQILTENILSEHINGLNLSEIADEISEVFNLSFSIAEIRNSLSKKSNKSIKYNNEVYFIDSETREKITKQYSISERLHSFVVQFKSEKNDISQSIEDIEKAFLNYLYFCFNSNVNNLLSLLNKKDKQITVIDSVNEADISIINEFIMWHNDEKNKFIYNTVAVCYEYCMLTVKNNNIISKELFHGKKFYLDSNIIFIMAGINKDERKLITNSFIDHCNKIGISLCCTSVTFDEIFRVIDAQINYIKFLTDNAPPISPDKLIEINPSYDINDFYKLYYEWTSIKGNNYRDYISFYEYVVSLIRDALESVNVIQIPKEKYTTESGFETLSKDLMDYKNYRHTWHTVSKASADTDLVNVEDIRSKRSRNQESIWQTNEFMVSADQLLISWTSEMFSGVPIVVLPSVWLSIILRFTGRATSDDYNSFCLFLTQRQNINGEELINPLILVGEINKRTTKSEIRDRIIEEISKHKSEYAVNNEDDNSYEDIVERAFDRVVKDEVDKLRMDYSRLEDNLSTQLQQLARESKETLDKKEDDFKKEKTDIISTEREKAAIVIAKKNASKRVKPFKWLSENKWIYGAIILIGIIVGIFLSVTQYQPIWNYLQQHIGSVIQNETWLGVILTLITSAFSALIDVIVGLLEKLGSSNREKRLYKKYYEEYLSTISTSSNEEFI